MRTLPAEASETDVTVWQGGERGGETASGRGVAWEWAYKIFTPRLQNTTYLHQTAKSTHHPHKIDDQHRECKIGGGAYFAFFLVSDNWHTTPFCGDGAWFAVPYYRNAQNVSYIVCACCLENPSFPRFGESQEDSQ